MANRALHLAALFVSEGEIQMRVRQSRRQFDGAQQVLNGLLGLPELLKNTTEVEFGE